MKLNKNKIHILFAYRSGPWGGGNQFLQVLRDHLRRNNLYSEHILNCSAILVNGHHHIIKAIIIKLLLNKKIIHRLDGLLHYHRGQSWKSLDLLILKISNSLFDGLILQSYWCRDEWKTQGGAFTIPQAIIYNSADERIFYKRHYRNDNIFRVISTSWSSNMNKGFNFLSFLDHHLNFKKYAVTFIGNSPLNFTNIKTLPPMTSQDLASELRQHHIYLSGAKNEACSNAIVEALASGLPVVALSSGSNAELIGSGGKMFTSEKDIIHALDRVSDNLDHYKRNIKVQKSFDISKQYSRFISEVPKRRNVSWVQGIFLLIQLLFFYYTLNLKSRTIKTLRER